jgi:hypothetical protein
VKSRGDAAGGTERLALHSQIDRTARQLFGGGMKRLLVAAVLASSPALAAPVGLSAPTKQEEEFAPRKAYRECLNRNFALRLIRDRNVASPETIAEGAMLDCRAEEGKLAAFAEELMPIVKDRMKAFLVSGGHVPENLWWP